MQEFSLEEAAENLTLAVLLVTVCHHIHVCVCMYIYIIWLYTQSHDYACAYIYIYIYKQSYRYTYILLSLFDLVFIESQTIWYGKIILLKKKKFCPYPQAFRIALHDWERGTRGNPVRGHVVGRPLWTSRGDPDFRWFSCSGSQPFTTLNTRAKTRFQVHTCLET